MPTKAPTSTELVGTLWGALALVGLLLVVPPATAYEWHIEVVDGAGNVGEYPSLALTDQDRPHISYYDADNGDLKYAHHDGSDWHILTVDAPGDVGRHTSLALDGLG